eukprot:IDg1380t1
MLRTRMARAAEPEAVARKQLLGQVRDASGPWQREESTVFRFQLSKRPMQYEKKKRLHRQERYAALRHNPAFDVYLNFNLVDRIDRSFAEISTPTRQNPQVVFFDMLWVQLLRSAWTVREEMVYAKLPPSTVRERANSVPDSESFSDFVRGVSAEMMRALCESETALWHA